VATDPTSPPPPARPSSGSEPEPPPSAADPRRSPSLAGAGAPPADDRAAAGSTAADRRDLEADDPDVLAAQLAADLGDVVDPPTKKKRWWVLPLRIAISGAMLWYLIRRLAGVSLADLVPAWTTETAVWLGIALALTVLSVVLSAARWRQVLVGMDVHSRFRNLVTSYFAGQFVSNVLPTTIGGDVLRISRLARETGDSPDSFASVTIERLTGWLVLPLLTFAGFALNPHLVDADDRSTLALVIAVGTLVTLVAILVIADHPRLGGRFANRRGWRRFLGAVHLGVARLRRHPRSAISVVAVGIVYQFVLVLAATAAARVVGIDEASVTVMLAFFPAVLIIQVLPIGISGLGPREGALVLFLRPLGVPESEAIALGLLLFALNLVVSLLGAPALLAGPPEPAATATSSGGDAGHPIG
jgi:glycosyltransferase 2 family protein